MRILRQSPPCCFRASAFSRLAGPPTSEQGSRQFYFRDNMLYGADSGQGSPEPGNRLREAMALADSASPSPAPLATEGPF